MQSVGRTGLAAAALVAVSLGAGGCFGGSSDGDEKADRNQRLYAGPTHVKRYRLAAARTVAVEMPDRPDRTAPSSMPGLELAVRALQRQGDGTAVLVLGLRNTLSEPLGTSATEDALGKLSAKYAKTSLTTGYSASLLSLVAGTKQYLPYMADPNDDATCLCSALPLNDVADPELAPGQELEFAAVLAAPPRGVDQVAVVTPLGSLPNVTLR